MLMCMCMCIGFSICVLNMLLRDLLVWLKRLIRYVCIYICHHLCMDMDMSLNVLTYVFVCMHEYMYAM